MVPFDRASRHQALPIFRRWNHHPLWHAKQESWIYEFHPNGRLHFKRYYESRTIPHTVDDEELFHQGYIAVPPHIPVFARNVVGSLDPKDDILVLFQASPEEVQARCPDEFAAIDLDIVHRLLGPRDGRVGSDVGGVLFEQQTDRAKHNGQGERCYSLGITVQEQRNVFHPAANMRRGRHNPVDDVAPSMIWFARNGPVRMSSRRIAAVASLTGEE